MKILHIIGDSKWGGGGIVIEALVAMAMENRWKADVLTTDPRCQASMSALGANIVSLDVIWRDIRPVRDLRGLLKLWSYLRAHHYDIVHTHTSKAGFTGRIAARLAGVPVVLHTLHGFAFHEETSWRKTVFYSLLERIAGWFCDAIVTVSHYHRDWALRLHIASHRKLRAIPNGIGDERVFSNDAPETFRQRIGVGQECFVVVTHGRLAADKGLEYLLAAVPRVIRRMNRPLKFVVVGDGPLRPDLLALCVQLGVSDSVVFDGFRSDVGNILAGADVIVLPTLREGLSISLLEAMAAGKAIIATNIGSNLEATVQGECALIVPTKDTDALADAIERLSLDPKQVRAGRSRKGAFLDNLPAGSNDRCL
jgi:glycosyltransferase involved in cell wall biosynthesis